MDRHRFMTTLILLHTALAGRLRALRASDERGSETTEKVLWISAVIAVVLLVYPILTGKLSDWFNNLSFGGL
ncbi:hypothetical protein [Actinoplanes subtropicus]|uniref:hypothetical protein n=1 Tax=Actinoplanes subtropicus TaxID=543632 RepID=UPI0004C403D8|nr:hypothetical protein [Actinoplanes subtropicus]